MDKQKETVFPRYRVMVLLLPIFSAWFLTSAQAQDLGLHHLQQSFNLNSSRGSRIKAVENRRCKSCEEKEANAKFEYLDRVLSEQGSASYQKEVESMIFTDEKFINGCWKKANKKGIEFFFTIDNSGEANDFAWFPKHRVGKCLKRHISKIEFPTIEKPHHARLVASDTAR